MTQRHPCRDDRIPKVDTMSDGSFTRSVKLTDAERLRMLSHLDEASRSQEQSVISRGRNKRATPRLSFRAANIALIANHPGRSTSKIICCSRNISENGLGVVHGGFLHPGTRCHVALPKASGERVVIEGEVVNCRHVSGQLHEIGIKFSSPINLQDFMTQDEIDQADHSSALQLPQIDATVVFWGGENQLLCEHLLAIGVDLVVTAELDDTIKAVKERDPKIMLVTTRQVAKHENIAESLREGGYDGPVVFEAPDMDKVAEFKESIGDEFHVIPEMIDLQELFDLLKRLLDQEVSRQSATASSPQTSDAPAAPDEKAA